MPISIPIKTKYFILKSQQNRRQARNSAYKIQQYNNFVIDEYVKSVDEGTPNKPAPAMLWAELSILNKPSVYKNYQKIITSKYTSNDAVHKMLIRNKAQKDLNRVVEAQVERLSKNVDYVENVLRNYEMPLQEYHRMLDEQQNRSVANRRKVMEEVLVQRNEILVSEGLNIPNTYNYRDLDVTAEQLLRESQSASEYEEAKAMNEEAIANGKSEVYTQKKWIWTGEGKTTRHANMESYPVIDFDNTFQVVNDYTDTMDEMLYPRDINGSPENVYGCVCEVEYS